MKHEQSIGLGAACACRARPTGPGAAGINRAGREVKAARVIPCVVPAAAAVVERWPVGGGGRHGPGVWLASAASETVAWPHHRFLFLMKLFSKPAFRILNVLGLARSS